MWTHGQAAIFEEYFQRYLELLAPLFAPSRAVQALFEFICCLIHPSGIEGEDENPLLETTALTEDLVEFSRHAASASEFDHPERTRARLALMSYCHLTEVDFFYVSLANLLRVQCGERWAYSPFADLGRTKKTKHGEKRIAPTVNKKLQHLCEYATKAGIPQLATALKEIYIGEIRNAVFHADYTLSDTTFHMLHDYWLCPEGYFTRDIPISELYRIVDRTFAFYYALLNRHNLARVRFTDLRGKAFPLDWRLKSLVEFLFEDTAISGFRIYWPNGQQAEFRRTDAGANGVNVWPELQEGLNISVGLYAKQASSFSPLVELGQQPIYTPASGRSMRPYWPVDGKAVPLE